MTMLSFNSLLLCPLPVIAGVIIGQACGSKTGYQKGRYAAYCNDFL
ncbi:MAG: hypothetical protein M0023_05945 [Desulfobacteraceae bacterium]|nr:hypothetical protein [Desulfobacteraceae bacterium]